MVIINNSKNTINMQFESLISNMNDFDVFFLMRNGSNAETQTASLEFDHDLPVPDLFGKDSSFVPF